jgi:hypothetical protein
VEAVIIMTVGYAAAPRAMRSAPALGARKSVSELFSPLTDGGSR